MIPPVTNTIKESLKKKLIELANVLDGDIFTYYGIIIDGYENQILKLIEDITDKKDKIFVVLTTGGGSAIAVERYVNILRHHYNEVNFIVPDYAFSAGTIFCMSGDNIYMDYFSVLGPIDPQVQNKDGNWVAALGYLDKINELIVKANNNTLSQAEFIILKDFDLAELKGYEQAKELTIDLLKKWLVNYKFKNWATHQTNAALLGQAVTIEQKEDRAKEIADLLSNNNEWKSHGRPINIELLENKLKLRIEDYSNNVAIRPIIRNYYELLADFVKSNNSNIFVQTKNFI
ncbi:SDH family Clp fold serine proteinase [Flavobacterium psychrotolerans]|uniref:Serine dehydrogenasease n=1 Tax=Flavobacterium psychrotolerans TaxID=2169410 RepID=A0A2U1JLF6_9FLAO|nr:serine dehydrogenasease [Flavobacterium psychrotolerans]PWA05688.1 serine dehydrogenasease [Flavobacterium psychrotolerans]